MPQDAQERPRHLPNEFDDTFAVGVEPGNNAFFGLNVLQGLIDGMDEFLGDFGKSESRWRSPRWIAPAVLGSSIWIDDELLIEKIREYSVACVVVKKQGTNDREVEKLDRLKLVNQQTPGMPVQAFSALTGLAPKENGKPVVLDKYSPLDGVPVPTFRTLGFRKARSNDSVPIPHAKLVLLGHLCWIDDKDFSSATEIISFRAVRLWVTSANFTSSSRRNLEFGFWTEDPALLGGAERYLVKLMRSSEALNPASDVFDPELAPVEYDAAVVSEALEDLYGRPGEDEMPDDWDHDN